MSMWVVYQSYFGFFFWTFYMAMLLIVPLAKPLVFFANLLLKFNLLLFTVIGLAVLAKSFTRFCAIKLST